MFKKDSCLTIVDQDTIRVLKIGSAGYTELLFTCALAEFISDPTAGTIPKAVRGMSHPLMIVPDYWLGNTAYEFQNPSPGLIAAFVERKLAAEHPEHPDLVHLYDYRLLPEDPEGKQLHVCYMHEPKGAAVYQRLADNRLAPKRVSTPARIWERKLGLQVASFKQTNAALVHILAEECYLYFFRAGIFLFSRSLQLPSDAADPSDRYGALTYEINQSVYLFSQKAKQDIAVFYVVVGDPSQDIPTMADLLARELQPLAFAAERFFSNGIQQLPGVVQPFERSDLLPSAALPGFSHKMLRKALAWNPVQNFALVVGGVLLLIVGMEALYIHRWEQRHRADLRRHSAAGAVPHRQILTQYNDALDLLLTAARRPVPTEVILKLAEALPENVRFKEIDILLEDPPQLALRGVLRADDPEALRSALMRLLQNLGRHFPASRSVKIPDIEFGTAADGVQLFENEYLFSFSFELKPWVN